MAWTVASLYIAVVIGAGFASGQEIVQFFVRFGFSGLLGVVIATVLLSIFGGLMIKKCHEEEFQDYQDLLLKTTKYAGPFFDILYTFFILLGLAIMLAGTDSLLQQVVGLRIGRYITAILVVIPMHYGPSKILRLTEKLVPVMILLMLYVAINTIQTVNWQGSLALNPRAISYSILYAGFNLGFSMAVFAGISQLVSSRKAALHGGVIGGLILGGLIALISFALFSSGNNIQANQLPILTIAENIGTISGLLYTLTIWLAMYTTALTHTVAVTTRISKVTNRSTLINSLIVVGLGLIIAKVGFVSLIQVTYPVFGVIGLYLLLKLLRL